MIGIIDIYSTFHMLTPHALHLLYTSCTCKTMHLLLDDLIFSKISEHWKQFKEDQLDYHYTLHT